VQSLPHPGGNATGFVNIEMSIGGKWLDILKQIAPNTERVLVVFNPKTAPQSSFYLDALRRAASSLGLTLTVAHVVSALDTDAAIADFAKLPNGGLVITPDSFTGSQAQRDQIISLAARFRVPAIYSLTFFVKYGGLASYGIDNADLLHGAATYVDRILKGEKPANLPVQLPTKFEFAINLTTAKALGLTMPDKLFSTAEVVIE
jgi:putative tryptophan/tyrosine transport system substrate-binding protein